MRALRIGLTGGIGAGKSLALDVLSRLGAIVIDTDDIARAQAKPSGVAYRQIVKTFGRTILKGDGAIDRAKLGELIFKNEWQRRKLEKITHPLIMNEASRRLQAAKDAVTIVAIPLLFESNLENQFDLTMTIEAPEAVRRRRVARRDALTEAQVGARMRAQLPASVRAARADVVVPNAGSRKRFIATLRSYYRGLELLRHGAAAAQ